MLRAHKSLRSPWSGLLCVVSTDHEVRHAAEDERGDGPQREDVRQDLGQEVDGHSVVTTDVLVTEDRQEDTAGFESSPERLPHNQLSGSTLT